jgi:hypothetical protein
MLLLAGEDTFAFAQDKFCLNAKHPVTFDAFLPIVPK